MSRTKVTTFTPLSLFCTALPTAHLFVQPHQQKATGNSIKYCTLLVMFFFAIQSYKIKATAIILFVTTAAFCPQQHTRAARGHVLINDTSNYNCKTSTKEWKVGKEFNQIIWNSLNSKGLPKGTLILIVLLLAFDFCACPRMDDIILH